MAHEEEELRVLSLTRRQHGKTRGRVGYRLVTCSVLVHTIACGNDVKYSKGHAHHTEDTYVDRAVHRAELILSPSEHREDQAGPEASVAHEEEELRVLSLIQRQR